MTSLRRRKGDRRLVNVRENWYRDVWLLIISGVVVAALVSAQNAIDQIQQSRVAACRAQNVRHDRTLRTLDAELRKFSLHAHRGRLAQIRASRASSIALINQLAPRQNCTAIVRRTKTH